MKVYGPYTRKDGRQIVIEIDDSGVRRTVSYPKWLVEQKLGRRLDPDLETVDHIDGDFTNNSLSNLRIVPRETHCKEDAIRAALIVSNCLWCGNECEELARDIRGRAKRGLSGPFCSKQCSGKYGAELQNKRVDKLPVREAISSTLHKEPKTSAVTVADMTDD